MTKTERYDHLILEQLRQDGRITVQRAAELLGVSESTVRRAFRRLWESEQVIQVYGGIKLAAPQLAQYSFEAVEGQAIREKRRIAHHALSCIRDGDTIFLDSGTTLMQLASLLAAALDEGRLSGLTVFTNSLANLKLLGGRTRVNLIGGEYRKARQDFCGYIAEETVRSLHFLRCFLGTDGYIPGTGFTTTDFLTARLNELVLSCSSQRIVLADGSKFCTPAVVCYSRRQPVDLLITDRIPAEPVRASLENAGTAWEVAAPFPDDASPIYTNC